VRVYWITWAVLLMFTVAMLWADGAAIPRLAFAVFMIAAMLTKGSIIAGTFMHLKSEHPGLVLTVVVGLLVMGTVLYVLIAPDAARIHTMTTAQGLQ